MKKINHFLFRSIVLIVIIFVSISFNSCQKSRNKQNATLQSQDLEDFSFRLKWVIYSSFASHFVALDKGYFANEKLNVTINPGGPGIDPIRLVATGVDDIGLAGYEQIIIAREKGIPIVAIGEDYIRSGVGLFSLKGSGIKEPYDFINRKVGISPGTDKHSLYMALINKLKINRDEIIEVPVAFNLNLLLNGTVDVFPGFVTNQPFVAEENGKPLNIIDPYDYGVRPGGNVYFTSEKTLIEKRQQLKGFLKAAIIGIIESQKMGDEEVVDIVLKYNSQLNKNAEIKIWGATKDILLEKDPPKVGFMYKEKWVYTAEISKEYGLIEHVPDIHKCYTNELIKEIHSDGLTNN